MLDGQTRRHAGLARDLEAGQHAQAPAQVGPAGFEAVLQAAGRVVLRHRRQPVAGLQRRALEAKGGPVHDDAAVGRDAVRQRHRPAFEHVRVPDRHEPGLVVGIQRQAVPPRAGARVAVRAVEGAPRDEVLTTTLAAARECVHQAHDQVQGRGPGGVRHVVQPHVAQLDRARDQGAPTGGTLLLWASGVRASRAAAASGSVVTGTQAACSSGSVSRSGPRRAPP